MKLIVAGYNIDSSLIQSLNAKNATPEVISAAYARISRSSKRVDQLRSESLLQVDKARRSNQNIIFEMGHASIAEHAVFNLDLLDVSRLLTEVIQRSRLASFTEKSQRYVTFSRDYLLPEELQNKARLKQAYIALMDRLFTEYEESFRALLMLHKKEQPQLKARELECLAKEDARYILPLSTKTQMGMTMNARSLEILLRRLSNNPLLEAKELKDKLINAVKPICPSLIRHTEADGYDINIDLSTLGFSSFLQQDLPWVADWDMAGKARLISAPQNADDLILSAILYERSELSWQENFDTLSRMPRKAKDHLWKRVFTGMQSWHKAPRAFEVAEFEFELYMSESCWAQFKRHRQCTMLKKNGIPGSFLLPPAVNRLKRQEYWEPLFLECADLADSLPEPIRYIHNYLKLNGNTCKVYAKMNLREIYHFIRLRSDEHAQWEIREVSNTILTCVKAHAPNAAKMLCGKSDFKQIC
jgi:flavin-dependent thymidylate synthase